MATGTYRVQPDEQGVVLRFGKWVDTTQPGLNWHFPYPVVVHDVATRWLQGAMNL